MAKLSDEEVLSILERERNQARDFASGQLGKERRMAYEYYYGKPFGNEEEGQSQVVSQLTAEVIDSALPPLLTIFAASDDAIKCEPRGEGDSDSAEQATDICRHVFWTQNNGFLILYEAIKDALLQKTGVIKYYWDVTETVKVEFYDGITEQQVTMLVSDPQVDIEQADGYPDPSFPQQMMAPPPAMPQQPMGAMPQQPVSQAAQGMPGPQVPPPPPMLYNVKVRRKAKSGQVRLDVIPPEEVLVSTRARTPDPQKTPYIGIRTRKTLSQLIDMGYAKNIVTNLRSSDQLQDTDGERMARGMRTGTVDFDPQDSNTPSENPSMREVWYNEEYALIDRDGDGIAELRACCSVGDTLLHDEEIERVPLAVLTPKIMPHEFYGVSLADDTMDLQLLKSTLWRQMLQNLYHTNNPMQYVIEGQVEVDDLLNPRPGNVVRGRVPGGVTPLTVPFVAGESFQMIEFLEKETEGRSGINRYGNTPSLNPDSLNKTLGGAEIAVEKSNERLLLIARTFAETGIKQLFQGILWLLSKHQDKAMTIRLRNKWVEVDPRAWQTEYDFSVNVGLGSGSKDQQVQHMMLYAQALQQGQAMGLVTPKNGYKFLADLGKHLGFKNSEEDYVTDPTAPDDPSNPKPQPQPSPQEKVAQINAQATMQQHQADMMADQQKFQAQAQIDAQAKDKDVAVQREKIQMEAASKQQEQQNALQIQAQNDARDDARAEREHQRALVEMEKEFQFKYDEMHLKYQFEADQREKDRMAQVAQTAHTNDTNAKTTMHTNQTQAAASQEGNKHVQNLAKTIKQALSAPKKVKRGADGQMTVVPTNPTE